MVYKKLGLGLALSCIVNVHGQHSIEELCSKAQTCKQQNNYLDAVTHLKTAHAVEPHNVTIELQLANALLNAGELSTALSTYYSIIRKRPDCTTSCLYNVGYLLKIAGHLDEARIIFEHLLAQRPDYDAARLSIAFTHLNAGNLKTGWKLHEWNLKKQGKNSESFRYLIANNGFTGKTILLTYEGGLGDTIQFVRYAERIKQRGAHVIVAVQKPLIPLFQRCSYIDTVVSFDTAIPSHDARATLMSLPALFGDSCDEIPCTIPYLIADPDLVTYWQQQIDQDHSFKIGLCWQPDLHNDVSRLAIAHRGIPLSTLAPLNTIPDLSFYSLQKIDGVEQLHILPNGFHIHTFDDFDESHGRFMDTAALMMSLDLIITTDSAIAHLAGALGKRVWLLLPYNTDWRWIAHQTTSVWYPTMRIYKQPLPFDWDNVIKQIHFDLALISQYQQIRNNILK